MTSLRWRYAWRQLWLNKTRSVLVILSIAVGVFAFAMIWGAASTLRRELPANYEAIRPAERHPAYRASFRTTWWMRLTACRRWPWPKAGRRRLFAIWTMQGEWHDMELFSLADFEDNRVDMVRPVRGAWPPPEREILIERNSLTLTGAEDGGSITLETSEGDRRTLRIAGLAHDMNQAPGADHGCALRVCFAGYAGVARPASRLQRTAPARAGEPLRYPAHQPGGAGSERTSSSAMGRWSIGRRCRSRARILPSSSCRRSC